MRLERFGFEECVEEDDTDEAAGAVDAPDDKGGPEVRGGTLTEKSVGSADVVHGGNHNNAK